MSTASLARPSWPLVAMITAMAASTMTALKIKNLAGSTLARRHRIAPSKPAWKIATSSTLLCHVVEPDKKGAGEEQRDDLNGEDDRSRDQHLDSPASFGEVVGHVPGNCVMAASQFRS
jgi:hypothetical protein